MKLVGAGTAENRVVEVGLVDGEMQLHGHDENQVEKSSLLFRWDLNR